MTRSSRLLLAAGLTAVLLGASCSGSDSVSERDPGSPTVTVLAEVSTAGTRATTSAPEAPELVPTHLTDVWNGSGAVVMTPAIAFDVTDFGAVADDDMSDSEAFDAALRAAPGTGAVIMVPAGQFLLTESLHMRDNTTLRGVGPTTRIDFDLGDESGHGIRAFGASDDLTWVPAESVEAGSTTLTVADSSNFTLGHLVEIEQRNIEAMYTDPAWDVDWGEGSEGELARIEAIDGNTLTLAGPLVSEYSTERAPMARPVRSIQNVGIESLTLTRVDEGYGNSISFRFADNVWISEVISTNTSRAHVGIDQVYGCSIENSILHGATDFGDGGRAYGISMARHTTSCLAVNNTLYDLRHALIIQLGASGNVFAYNHARGSAGYEDKQPRADISLHGHWPQRNLFEGNVVDRIIISDWWGPSGPLNTMLRNCVLDEFAVMDSSHSQLLIGNVVKPGGLTIEDSVNDTLVEATAPISLWTTEAPAFLGVWPPIDAESSARCDVPASTKSPLGNQ